MVFYYIVAILAGLATVAGVLHQVFKKTVRETSKAAAEQTASALQRVVESVKDRPLNESIEGYNSVLTANKALRQVIEESSAQMAESAAQLGRNAEVLAAVRADLARCQDDKADLTERMSSLEARMRLMARDMSSFTEAGRQRAIEGRTDGV